MSGKRMKPRGHLKAGDDIVSQVNVTTTETTRPDVDPLDRPMTFRQMIQAIENLLEKIPGMNSGHYILRSLPGEIRSLAQREDEDARDPVERRAAG